MKKTGALFLCVVMLLSFSGCGKSKNAQAVDDQIAALGEITAASQSAVETAEAAFAALNEKERKDVESYAALQEARSKLDSALRISTVEEQIRSLGEITAESGDAIEAAEAALRQLPAEEQTRVSNAGEIPAAREALAAALHQAELASLRESLLGRWAFTVDITEPLLSNMEQQLGDVDVDVRDYIEECLLDGVLEFREDGTYVFRLDREAMMAAVNSIKPGLMKMAEAIIARQLSQALTQQGLSGDFSTLESIESYFQERGVSLDELFRAKTGSGMRELLSEAMDAGIEGALLSGVETSGNYEVDFDAGKLFMTESTDEFISGEDCEMIRLSGDTLEILGYMGEGMFPGMYPITMTKTA